MQAQKTGGSIVSITAALADNRIAGIPASLAMITKRRIETLSSGVSASEYVKEDIRFNAVAPGIVDSPLHHDLSEQVVNKQSPMGESFDDR